MATSKTEAAFKQGYEDGLCGGVSCELHYDTPEERAAYGRGFSAGRVVSNGR